MAKKGALSARDSAAALLLASNRGLIRLAGSLLEGGADVEAADPRGVTPLIAASEAGHLAMVRFLLARGAQPMTLRHDNRSAWELADGPYAEAIRTEIEERLWAESAPPAAVRVRRAQVLPDGASTAFLRRFSRRSDRFGLIAARAPRSVVTEALLTASRGGLLRDLQDRPLPAIADPTFVFSLRHSHWTWVVRGVNRQGFDHRTAAERAARRLERQGLEWMTFLATGGVSATTAAVAWEQDAREEALGFRSPRGRVPWPGRLAPVLQEDLDRFFDAYGLSVPLLDVERTTESTRLVLDLGPSEELDGVDLLWT